jgi:hypothetical protein
MVDPGASDTLLTQYGIIQSVDGTEGKEDLQPIEEEATTRLLVDGRTQRNIEEYSNRDVRRPRLYRSIRVLILVVILILLLMLLCLLLAGSGVVIYFYVFNHKPGSISPASNVTNVTIKTINFTSQIGANTTVFVSEEIFNSNDVINFTISSDGPFPQMISFYTVPSDMISYTSVDLAAFKCQFSSEGRGSINYHDQSCHESHYTHHPIYTAGNGLLQFHLTLTPSVIGAKASCYFQLYVFDDKNAYMNFIDNDVTSPPHVGSICLTENDFFHATSKNVTLTKNKFYYAAYSLMNNVELSWTIGGHIVHIDQNGMYKTECALTSTTDRCVVDVSSYHSDITQFFLLAHTENTSEEDINVTVFTKSHNNLK